VGTAEPRIERTEVDGIPTWWVDGPRPFTAVLTFRVGSFDETARTKGITHLVEHLAFYPHRHYELGFNGHVDGHFARLYAQGHPDKVGEFLRLVTTSIHDLPLDRLATEAEVLRREAAGLPGAWTDQILWAYFGPYGPGLVGIPENGLGWLDGEHLTAWASRYFTRENAALTLVGKPPTSWGLSLPPGEPQPYRLPERIPPAPNGAVLLQRQEHGVTWAALVRDAKHEIEPALHAAMFILAKRLQERLRHDLGHVYSINEQWVRLDRDHALTVLGFDVDPANSAQASRDYHQVVRQLLADGPEREEQGRFVRALIQAREDNPLEFTRAMMADRAEVYLAGWGEQISTSAYLEACEAMTPAEVKDRFAEAYRQSYTVANLVPDQLPVFHSPFLEPAPQAGVQFETRWKYRSRQPAAIRVGPGHVAARYADGWINMPWGEIPMVGVKEEEVSVYSARAFLHAIPGQYLKSQSFWRLPVTGYSSVIVAATFALYALSVPSVGWAWLVAVLAGLGGWWSVQRLLIRIPDPKKSEIRNRRLSLPEALREYAPPDLLLPPPRTEPGEAG